jgi:hypothetical protein
MPPLCRFQHQIQKPAYVYAWRVLNGIVSTSLARGTELTRGSSVGSGWLRHKTYHTFSDHPCFAVEDEGRTNPMHNEFIKYAGLLAATARSGSAVQADIVRQYKESWGLVYPNRECQLDDKGLPFDNSLDDAFPGRASAAGSSSTLNPLPSSSGSTPVSSSSRRLPVPSSPHRTPIPSSSRSTRVTPAPPASFSPHPQASPSSPSPPPDHNVVMWVLHQKSFPILIRLLFPSISGGLVPGFDPTNPTSNRVRILFVENMLHQVSKDSAPGAFISEQELDKANYDRIFDNFCHSILKLGNGSKGKVKCLIASWVSR